MKTLAIVDDNMMMREFLKSYFSKKYKVETFENGSQIMTYIESHGEPSVILLDYEMDGMNGQEILEAIKSSGLYQDIPVILLSGKRKSETRISCLKSGAHDFISKPFNPVELDLKIHNVIR